MLITDYVGPPPASKTYTANPVWVTATGCNGIVTSAASADLTPCATASSLEALTAALGTFNGTSASTNHAWASTTTGDPAADLVELETATPVALGAPSRFVTASVNVAAISCTLAPPLLKLFLLDGATALAGFTTPHNPCPGTEVSGPRPTPPRARR